MNQNSSVRKLARCAVVAAIYVVLCMALQPFSYGAVQVRVAEALCLLPVFGPEYIAGVVLGCFLANVFSTVTALDMVVGTLATALACLWTIKCRKTWFIPMPNVLVNAVIVGGMLAFVLFPDNLLLGFATAFVQVGFGELMVMYVLGVPLYFFEQRTGFVRKLMHP